MQPNEKPRLAHERGRGQLFAIPISKEQHMPFTRSRARRHPGTFPLLDYAIRPPLAFPVPRGDWRVRHLTNRFGASRVEARLFLDSTESGR
jgi:hypothetical protein